MAEKKLTTGYGNQRCPSCVKRGRQKASARIVSSTSGRKRSSIKVKCSGCGEMKYLHETTGC